MYKTTVIAKSEITKELIALAKAGRTEFATDPTWTFAAGQPQTPPELTVLPLKRVWSGQISDKIIVQMLTSNQVDAVVLYQDTMKDPTWTNFISHYLPTARYEDNILFVRRELNPKAIELDQQKTMLQQLGL